VRLDLYNTHAQGEVGRVSCILRQALGRNVLFDLL